MGAGRFRRLTREQQMLTAKHNARAGSEKLTAAHSGHRPAVKFCRFARRIIKSLSAGMAFFAHRQ